MTTLQALQGTILRMTQYKMLNYFCSLFCYNAAIAGRNVSCSAWNRSNPDLIAIGYGQYEFTNQKGGLIACWSLKNPEYPERYALSAAYVGGAHMTKSTKNSPFLRQWEKPNQAKLAFGYSYTLAIKN